MSDWTHITATLDIDTFAKRDDLKKHIESLIKHAPKITGSEGDAQIFVNVLNGHNSFTNMDCDRCPYFSTIKHREKGGFECHSPEDFKCITGEYQTRVLISIIGDLRDRIPTQTRKEYREFEKYIKKLKFLIRNSSLKIKG